MLRTVTSSILLAILSVPFCFAQDAPSFLDSVEPIFARRCSGCHYPTAERLKGGLDLSTVELALRGGKSGAVIIPGDAANSMLVAMIEQRGSSEMPPLKVSDKIPQEEIDAIRAWIDAGAPGAALATSTLEAAPELAATEEHAVAAHPEDAPVSAFAWSPDGTVLARGSLHTVEMCRMDASTGVPEVLATLEGHADLVRALAFSPDGTLLAAGGGKPSRTGETKLWRVSDSSLVHTLGGHTDNLLSLAFSPDGKTLATCSYDRLVKLWDVETGEERHSMKDHVDAVYAVAFSPDGALLASGAGDRTVKLWNAGTGERLMTFSDSTDAVMSLAFSPDGRYLAAGSADKMIRVWDVEASTSNFTQAALSTGKMVQSAFAHDGAVLALAYSPDGKTLYSTGSDGRIKAWDTAAMTEGPAFEQQPDWVLGFALSPDGTRIAAGRYNATSAIYDTATHQPAWRSDGEVQLAAAEILEEETVEPAAGEPAKKIRNLAVDAVLINATIPPSIQTVAPPRPHRGSEFDFVVKGKNLADAEPIVTDPSIQAVITANEAQPVPEFNYDSKSTGAQIHDYAVPHEVTVKVTIPDTVAPGYKEIFFKTPLGLTNGGGFTVLAKPDVGEAEPNNEIEQAAVVEYPAVVIGAINAAGDIDRFRIKADANDELVFALTDTALNASLRLLDATGNEIAVNHATHLAHRFDAPGEFIVELGDKDLRANLGYRLHIGAFPVVEHLEPLGVPAGEPRTVSVKGYNLGDMAAVEVDPPDTASYGQTIGLPVPAVEGNPLPAPQLAVGQFAEVAETEPNNALAEAQALEAPVTVNGRIDAADQGGEADLYAFHATAGQPIVIEVQAARLGSDLDSVVEILDADGHVLQRATARCVAKSRMTLSDRDSKSAGFRIDDWRDFRVNDWVMAGGEILKVRDLPDYGDEDIAFAAFGFGQRKAYFGTTPEYHAVNTPVYKVEIHPVDADLAPNGMPIFPIYWRNDDYFFEGARGGDSYLVFDAPADGGYILRVHDTFDGGGENYEYRLMLRHLAPDFRVTAGPYRNNINAGGRVPLDVRIMPSDGFVEPVAIEVHDLPAGYSIAPTTILPGEESVNLLLEAASDAQSMDFNSAWKITATAMVKGATLVREVNLGPVFLVDKQPDLVVHAVQTRLDLPLGRAVSLGTTLERFNGFTSRVPIDVLNLPFGVRVLDTGLNGILVREGETDRTMELYAEPWVEPMTRTIYLQARIESVSPGRMLFLSAPIELHIGAAGPAPAIASAE